MFDFRNGMLGVVVITLAVAGALFGSYLAGYDSEQVEVTKYNYLADVSGLFEYDQSPQYIDFDPSSNYTGYYSDDSYSSQLNKYYFAEGQVDYTPNANVNNYKLDRAPITDTTITDDDISSVTEEDVPGLSDGLNRMFYHTEAWNTENDGTYTAICKGTTLVQLLEDMEYDTYDLIMIASENSIDVDLSGATTSNPVQTGWVCFLPASWVSNTGGSNPNQVHLASQEIYDQWTWPDYVDPELKLERLCLSCIIDMKTRMVKLYYDNEFQTLIGQYNLEKMYMLYSSTTDVFFPPQILLSNEANITVQDLQDATYLNPNEGVSLL